MAAKQKRGFESNYESLRKNSYTINLDDTNEVIMRRVTFYIKKYKKRKISLIPSFRCPETALVLL